MKRVEDVEAILKRAREVVEEQAKDDGLWFMAKYASESYLQDALRKLHAIIDNNDLDLILFDK